MNLFSLTWRDVDQMCQRHGGDFDLTCRRMGLDAAEMRAQKKRELALLSLWPGEVRELRRLLNTLHEMASEETPYIHTHWWEETQPEFEW